MNKKNIIIISAITALIIAGVVFAKKKIIEFINQPLPENPNQPTKSRINNSRNNSLSENMKPKRIN